MRMPSGRSTSGRRRGWAWRSPGSGRLAGADDVEGEGDGGVGAVDELGGADSGGAEDARSRSRRTGSDTLRWAAEPGSTVPGIGGTGGALRAGRVSPASVLERRLPAASVGIPDPDTDTARAAGVAGKLGAGLPA
jgi:hypothetical protein